jgi:hypothetical protein
VMWLMFTATQSQLAIRLQSTARLFAIETFPAAFGLLAQLTTDSVPGQINNFRRQPGPS